MTATQTLEELCINTIRVLSADAVQNANSGHPGMPMGAAAMAFTLWNRFLKHNPKDPNWFDRDRFILSAGHGSMLLYSLLHLTGYDLPLDELKHFRKLNSKTPGHPERGHTVGVEVATGPLGQGFSNGVGMAMAEAWLAAKFNRPGHDIIDHYIYAICGDGDLMEGITQEAASIAGHLKLGKLIYLYDNNHISLAGATGLIFTEDVRKRFDSYGWHTRPVADGNDTEDVARAIQEAQAETRRPSLILSRTHIGYGSPKKQDTFGSHGSPLGEEELAAAKKALGWPTTDKFFIPPDALAEFRKAIDKGRRAQQDWDKRWQAYQAAFPKEAAELEACIAGKLPEDWAADLPKWQPSDKAIATRVAGGLAMNAIAKRVPNLVGGSADLNPSTETALKGMGDFQPPEEGGPGTQGAVGGEWGYGGRNMAFGVREHAMGAAVNGMAAHGGVLPFSATFMVFSDYMKPAIRLGSLSQLHVIYVFTHDSIGLGEDGPTHQPIEQLASLRSIPNITVLRPADSTEVVEAWKYAIEHRTGPVALALARQKVPTIDRTKYISAENFSKGAYVLAESSPVPDLILIGTGSEVQLVLDAYEQLIQKGIAARVISMPSWELFEQQSKEYKEKVFPSSVKKRIAVEAGAPMGWHKYVGDEGVIIGISKFGASAPYEVVFKEYGFTVENVVKKAEELLR